MMLPAEGARDPRRRELRDNAQTRAWRRSHGVILRRLTAKRLALGDKL